MPILELIRGDRPIDLAQHFRSAIRDLSSPITAYQVDAEITLRALVSLNVNPFINYKRVAGFLQDIGYKDPEHNIFPAWQNACSDFRNPQSRNDRYVRSAIENFITICRLESLNPQSASFLTRNFGIKSFSRYPVELLDDQARNVNDTISPYGVIITPREDPNGVFYNHYNSVKQLYDSIKFSHAIRVVEVGSRQDLARALINLRNRYEDQADGTKNKISFAMIQGHGTNKSIRFGQKENGLLTLDDVTRASDRFADFFITDAPIVLASCRTGVKGGIGQALSRKLRATTLGPEEETSVWSMSADLKDNRVNIGVAYYKGGTNLYYQGDALK